MNAAQAAQLFNQALWSHRNGQVAQAEAICRDILAANPSHAGALYMLGTVAMQIGRPDVAVDWIGKAIASDDQNAAYHNDLGLALQALGRPDDASASYRRAISLAPENGRCYNNLAALLQAQGRLAEASEQFAKALMCTPELFDTFPDIKATLFKLNPAVEVAAARAEAAWPRRLSLEELFEPGGFSAAAKDSLLQCILVCSPVRDVALEHMLTNVRAALLKLVAEGDTLGFDEDHLNLCCALARQCFINEFIFATTAEEVQAAKNLEQLLASAIKARSAVAPHVVAVVASYFVLDTISDAQVLLDRSAFPDWPRVVDELLTMQLREPLEEQRLKDTFRTLTTIDDPTSLLVKQQYEENPYPRWVLAPSRPEPVPLNVALGLDPATSPHGTGGKLEALVAGCGTGRQPIVIARMYLDVHLLAIDLSRASLAYAQRKSHELGVDNITYAQADILQLASLGQTFDVVDASGVLHHLADPEAGWKILLSLVLPQGFMKIGLYSENARRDVVAARAYCAERGFLSTAQDIRVARQELLKNSEHKGVVRYNDFFSTSECRDLLFHAQEHRFTIAEIRAFLAANNLRFLGFDIRGPVIGAYRKQFPDDPAMRDLGHWQEFETKYPDTFASMYQFLVQRQ